MNETVSTPLLSVVIPCYNVEAWLGECLDSVTSQSLTDLEVVVVIDGSPDGSAEIAHDRASGDARIRVIDRKHNIGLGASRNEGLREARGTFVTFADSDDIVAPGAYDALVGSLRRTGSDMAIGWASEFGGPRGRRRYWTTATKLHDTGAERTSLEAHPELITDHVAWNKVFRREFLLAHGITWPEGVKCEDVLQTTDALIAARAVDVVPAEVIRYRRREGQITGSLDSGTTLLDWAEQTRLTLGRLADPRWSRARARYAERVLHGEMRSRLASIVRATDPRVLTAVGEVLDTAVAACPAARLAHVDLAARQVYVLLATGRADLLRAVAPELGEPELAEWPKASGTTIRGLSRSLGSTPSRWEAALLAATLAPRADQDLDRLEPAGEGLVTAQALAARTTRLLPAHLRAALRVLADGGDITSARDASWLARYTTIMAHEVLAQDGGAIIVRLTVRCTMIDSSRITLESARVRGRGKPVAVSIDRVGTDSVRRIVADLSFPTAQLPDESSLKVYLTLRTGDVRSELRVKIAADVPTLLVSRWRITRTGPFLSVDPVPSAARRAARLLRRIGRRAKVRLGLIRTMNRGQAHEAVTSTRKARG